MNLTKALNEIVFANRLEFRLTQKELADALDVTPQYLSMVEKGRAGLVPIKWYRVLCELFPTNPWRDLFLLQMNDHALQTLTDLEAAGLSKAQLKRIEVLKKISKSRISAINAGLHTKEQYHEPTTSNG